MPVFSSKDLEIIGCCPPLIIIDPSSFMIGLTKFVVLSATKSEKDKSKSKIAFNMIK